MGREVRRVPGNWQHPKDESGRYIPLFGGSLSERQRSWDEENEQWEKGFYRLGSKGEWKPKEPHMSYPYADWDGARPDPVDYMPDWPESDRTHYQMYEDTSEGTPISPPMETPEALAEWLEVNGASFFGDIKSSSSHWLRIITGEDIGLPIMAAHTGQVVNAEPPPVWPDEIEC